MGSSLSFQSFHGKCSYIQNQPNSPPRYQLLDPRSPALNRTPIPCLKTSELDDFTKTPSNLINTFDPRSPRPGRTPIDTLGNQKVSQTTVLFDNSTPTNLTTKEVESYENRSIDLDDISLPDYDKVLSKPLQSPFLSPSHPLGMCLSSDILSSSSISISEHDHHATTIDQRKINLYDTREHLSPNQRMKKRDLDSPIVDSLLPEGVLSPIFLTPKGKGSKRKRRLPIQNLDQRRNMYNRFSVDNSDHSKPQRTILTTTTTTTPPAIAQIERNTIVSSSPLQYEQRNRKRSFDSTLLENKGRSQSIENTKINAHSEKRSRFQQRYMLRNMLEENQPTENRKQARNNCNKENNRLSPNALPIMEP